MDEKKRPAPRPDLQVPLIALMGATALHLFAVAGWFDFSPFFRVFRSGFTYSGEAFGLLNNLRGVCCVIGCLGMMGLCAALATRSRLVWLFVGAELIAPTVWLGYFLLEREAAPPDERGVRASAYIGSFCIAMTFLHVVRARALALLIKRGLHSATTATP
jgi:hypothetical protein